MRLPAVGSGHAVAHRREYRPTHEYPPRRAERSGPARRQRGHTRATHSLRRSRRPDKAHDYPRMAGARREGRTQLRRGPGRVPPTVAPGCALLRKNHSTIKVCSDTTRKRLIRTTRVDARIPRHDSVRGDRQTDTDTTPAPAATAGRRRTRRATPGPLPDSCPIGRWYRWGRGRLERWGLVSAVYVH
jgi:hypothetical protein